MLSHTIQFGLTKESISACSSYAAIFDAINEDVNKAHAIYMTGYRLSEKYMDYYYISDICIKGGNFVLPWIRHLRETHEINIKGSEAGFISGEMIYAILSLTHMTVNSFNYGEQLQTTRKMAAKHLVESRKTNNIIAIYILSSLEKVIEFLTGTETSDKTDTKTFDRRIERYNIPRGYHCIFQMQASYLFHDYRKAYDLSLEIKKILPELFGLFMSAEFIFYHSLTLAALVPSADEEARSGYMSSIKSNQLRMKRWADRCGENFMHKYLLVEAELASLGGDTGSAMKLYADAVKSASGNRYIQNEALANELAARFWNNQGMTDIAALYLQRACAGYESWGADRKAKQLESAFPSLKKNIAQGTAAGPGSISESAGGMSIVKSLQAISGEIETGRLMHTLMRNMLQYEGGTRIVLFLEKNRRIYMEAEGLVMQGTGEIKTLLHDSHPLEECSAIPLRLIRYCSRTGETVILNDARNDENPVQSEYLKNGRAKSVLCVRSSSGTTSVVTYVENFLMKNVFTPDRVEVLKLLAVQAAISLENARLYREQEETTRRLTEMSDAREKLLRQYEEARHKAMMDRTNPHFIYNAIHTIHALIQTDPAEADRGTLMLAEIMRFLTDRSFEELVPIDDELRFTELYLSFEKISFPDTLSYTFKTAGDMKSVMIPPLTIQPLVENAIKHGLRKNADGGEVNLTAVYDGNIITIMVADSGPGLTTNELYLRTVGNIRERLRYYFPDAELTLENSTGKGAVAAIKFRIPGENND